jgi:superfamily II DNA or RNA helicase
MSSQGLTKKQKLMIAFGQAHPYAILAAEPRLGKTRSAIEIKKKTSSNCLVVCPSYLISNWKKEINKWAPDQSVTTFKKGADIYDVCDSDFVVTSYDLVQKAEHLFEWADMVISDETHNLKNMASKKSSFFHQALFENSVKRFYGLTGTPIKNRVKEFYSLLALTNYDPRQTDHSFLDKFPDEITFADHFSNFETYTVRVSKGKKTWDMPVTRYFGIKNTAELKKWLKGKYLRIRADKADLPPISYVDTLVSDLADANLLKAFNNYFVDEAEIRQLVRTRQVTEAEARELRTSSVLPEHKRNAAIKKIPFTIKYVENLMESVKCCLVYSDHREPVEKIAAHFKVPAITGSMSGNKRAELVNNFQSGKLNILCATIGALKEGADLFRAKDLVLNDMPWVPGDLQQVINRTRALGHKKPRTVHRIMGSPQDAKICGIIEEKIRTIEQAT